MVLCCLSLAFVRAVPRSRDLGSDFNLIPISICDQQMLKNLKSELINHMGTMLLRGDSLANIFKDVNNILDIGLQSIMKAQAAFDSLTYINLPYDFLVKKLHMMMERVNESVGKMCPSKKLEIDALSLENQPYKDSMVSVIDKADLSDRYFEVTFSQVNELLESSSQLKVQPITEIIEKFIDKNLKTVYTCLNEVTEKNEPKKSEKYTNSDYSVVLKFFEKLINYQKTSVVFKGLFGSNTRVYKPRPKGNLVMSNFFSTIESDSSAIFHFLRMDSAWLGLPSRKPLTFRTVKVAMTQNYLHIPALLNVADMHAEHFFSMFISPRYVVEAQKNLYYIMLHLISLKIITNDNYRYAGHIIRQWILKTKCWDANLDVEKEEEKPSKVGNNRRRILPKEEQPVAGQNNETAKKGLRIREKLANVSAKEKQDIADQVITHIQSGGKIPSIQSGGKIPFRIKKFPLGGNFPSITSKIKRRPVVKLRPRSIVKDDPVEWDEFGILARSRVFGAIPFETPGPVPVETIDKTSEERKVFKATEHNSFTVLHFQGKENEILKKRRKFVLGIKPINKNGETKEEEKKEENLITWKDDEKPEDIPAKREKVIYDGCTDEGNDQKGKSSGKSPDNSEKEQPKTEFKIYSTIFEKDHPFKFQGAECVVRNTARQAILEMEKKEASKDREEICEIKKFIPNFATFFTMIWRLTRVMDGWTTKKSERALIVKNKMLLSLFDQSLLHAEQDIHNVIINILPSQRYYKMVVQVLGNKDVYSIGEPPAPTNRETTEGSLGAMSVDNLRSHKLQVIQDKKNAIYKNEYLKKLIACTAFKADVQVDGKCTYTEEEKFYSKSIGIFFDVMYKAESHVSEFFISIAFTILKESLGDNPSPLIPKKIASRILTEMNTQIVNHQISITKEVRVDGFKLFMKDLLFGRGLNEISFQAPDLIKSNPSMLYDLRFFLLEGSQEAETAKFKSLMSKDTTSGLNTLIVNEKFTNFDSDTELYSHRLGLQLFNRYVKIFDYYDFTGAGKFASPDQTPEKAMNDLFVSIYLFLSEVRMSKEIEASNFHQTVWRHLIDCLDYTKDRELQKSSDPKTLSYDKCPMALRKYTEIFYFIFFFIAKDVPDHLSEYLIFSSERIEYRLDPFFRYLYFPETDLLSQVKEVCDLQKDWLLCIGVNVFNSFKLFIKQGGSNFSDFYVISLKKAMVNINNFLEKGIAEEAEEKSPDDAEKTSEEIEKEKAEAEAEAAERREKANFRKAQIRAILWNVMFSLSKIDNGKFIKLIDQGRLQYKAYKKGERNSKSTIQKEDFFEFFEFFDLVEFEYSEGNEEDVEFLADFLMSRFASRRHSSKMKERTELIENFWQDYETNDQTKNAFTLQGYAISEILEFLSKYTHSLEGFKAIARALIRGNIVLDMINWTYSSINEFEQFYLETLELKDDSSSTPEKKNSITLLDYIKDFKELITEKLKSISNSFKLQFRPLTPIKVKFNRVQLPIKGGITIPKVILRREKITFANQKIKKFAIIEPTLNNPAPLKTNIDLNTIVKKFCQFNSKGEIYLSDDTINRIFLKSTYKFCWVNVSVRLKSEDNKNKGAEEKPHGRRNII